MLIRKSSGFESVFSARSLATHLAGSKYWTCESHRPVVTNRAGYACARDVVVRRVGEHVVVELLLVRVAPLVELVRRERNAVIEHRRDDVDERHVRDDPRYSSGARFATRAISRPPALPPRANTRSRIGVFSRHQESGHVDEVGEGVTLL